MRWDRLGRIGLLVVLGVVVELYAQHALDYFAVRAQSDTQLAVVQQLTRQNKSLERQAKALQNPATIEQDARALGMVRNGERPYVVMNLPRR